MRIFRMLRCPDADKALGPRCGDVQGRTKIALAHPCATAKFGLLSGIARDRKSGAIQRGRWGNATRKVLRMSTLMFAVLALLAQLSVLRSASAEHNGPVIELQVDRRDIRIA